MMKGPQLDARSYAILILVVIASITSINSFAQRNTDNNALTDASATVGLANATRDVADATREVAKANLEIAQQLREVALALKSLKPDDKAVTVNSAPLPGSTPAAEPQATPTRANSLVGTIEFN
ncbi:MAG: hypothetical protein ACFCU1_06620 [Sumerlaeia bacterium]